MVVAHWASLWKDFNADKIVFFLLGIGKPEVSSWEPRRNQQQKLFIVNRRGEKKKKARVVFRMSWYRSSTKQINQSNLLPRHGTQMILYESLFNVSKCIKRSFPGFRLQANNLFALGDCCDRSFGVVLFNIKTVISLSKSHSPAVWCVSECRTR